jgi:hypothetical protein
LGATDHVRTESYDGDWYTSAPVTGVRLQPDQREDLDENG